MKNKILKTRTGRCMLFFVAAIALLAVFASSPNSARASSIVNGIVKTPLGGVPSALVQLCYHGPNGDCKTTNADGTFQLTIPPGHYQIYVTSAPGYGPGQVREFDVYDGQTTNLEMTLTEIQLQGTLKKADGTPIRGWINIHTQDRSKEYRTETPGNDGLYVLGGMDAGIYIAEAGPFNDATGVIAPAPSEVTIAASGVVTKDFVFSTATKTLTGSVKRTTGAVVTTACINANRMNGPGNAGTHADQSGNYTLSLSGGSWNVQINPCEQNTDWIYANPPVLIEFAEGTSVEAKVVDFTVTTANATLAGSLKDTSGNAVTTGNIDVRSASGVGNSTQLTSTGTFSIRLTAGSYEVRFWTPGNAFTLPPTNITLAEGETKTLNLVVKMKTAHIKGTVRTSGGLPAGNVSINGNEMTGPGGGPGAWGNTRSAADGTYDLAVNAGTYNVNIGTEPGSSFVPVTQGPQTQIEVATDTTTVTGVDFTVMKADATITGKVTVNNQPVSNVPGCAYARAVGSFGETCFPIDNQSGSFTIKVSSSTAAVYEIGCHFPPNVPYSCGAPVQVTIMPNGTVSQNIELLANNSTVSGRIFDSSGFPLTNCTKLKGGMVFIDGNNSHYQGSIDPNTCSYSISLVAGVYNVGASFPPESGALNPPPGMPIQVFSSQTVQRNIQFIAADAMINVSLLDQSGNGTQGFINVDNSAEINMAREGDKGGPGDKGGADLGFGKKMPCNASDASGVMKCCKDVKNKSACIAFVIPQGPNGCKNAWECTQLCVKTPTACKDIAQDKNSGAQPGQGTFKAGPGGCKSETECKAYCSKQEHFDECAKFKPPASASIVRISSKTVSRIMASSTTVVDKTAGFDKMIHSGGQTDMKGIARIPVLSGHKYRVCAGLPPQSNAMPPKCQDVDLTTLKSANVTMSLRNADATISGVVTLDGKPIAQAFVHGWAEDGSFSGQPVSSDGKYTLNLTCNTTWHIGADSFRDTAAYRSDEFTKVITCDTKKYSQNFALVKQDFQIPLPVSVSGACSDTISLGLTNGVKLEVPGGAISDSTDGTCTLNATPTIELMATRSDQPEGVGYTIEARDENGAIVAQLTTSATFTLPYTLTATQNGSSYEDGLSAVFYDSSLGAYKRLENCSQDKDANNFKCRVDHFSAYTVANSSGKSAKASSLLSVTTAKTKAGLTTFTVNKKKVTPFACKGTVSVATKSVNGTQLIAAVADCDGYVKVYDTKAVLKGKVKSGWKGIQSLTFSDVNKDTLPDVIITPKSGTDVKVIQPGKKYAVTSIPVVSGAASLTASAIDFTSNGIPILVTGVLTNGAATNMKVFIYAKGAFKAGVSLYTQYLTGTGGVIRLSIPAPVITSITPASISKASTKATITIKGKNLTPDMTALVGTVGAKVVYKSPTMVKLTFNATKIGKGSFAIKATNPGGMSITTTKVKVKVE